MRGCSGSMAGIAVLAIAVAGCATATGDPASGFPACPQRAPAAAGRPPAIHARGPVAVPATAAAAQLCLYGAPSDRSNQVTLRRVVIMSRGRAAALTQLLRTGRSTTSSACIADPLVVRLRSPGGRITSYAVGGCRAALLVGEHGFSPLRGWIAEALGGVGSDAWGSGKAPAPDLVGMSLAHAIAVAKRGKVQLFLAHELSAPERLGTVVWQDPLPGEREDAASRQVSLIVAAHRARACRSRDLAGRYVQGGRATGQLFGSATIANTASRPCRLSGRLRLRGLAPNGHAVTATVSQPIEGPLVLSPRSSPTSVPPALLAAFLFFGNQRDDPAAADGLCYDHETTPAAWEVALSTGAHLRFANGNGDVDHSFGTCHGDLHFDTELNAIGAIGVQLLGP